MTPELLADENFPLPSVALLRSQGYDVWAVAEQASGLSDRDVLDLANREHRWLITFDRDFGELLFARGHPSPPAVILVRMTHYRPEQPGQLVARALANDSQLLGYFVVLHGDGLRKRPLPHQP